MILKEKGHWNASGTLCQYTCIVSFLLIPELIVECILQSLSSENITAVLELSENAHATSLKKSSILFILKHFAEFR